MNTCNPIFCLLLGLFLYQTETANGQQREPNFPYQALIIGESAEIHSGPGSVHYPTDELKQNSTVNVFRHDPGGWCAIRPPADSFSLVPESVVEKIADNVGRIAEEGVQAWVGTRLGSVERPLWQVKLKQGERVEILGEVNWPNPEGHSTVWYQIAPPAGEFRWIRISDIQLPKYLTDLPEVAEDGTADRIQSDLDNSELDGIESLGQSGFQESDASFDELKLDPPSEKDGTTNRGWKQASRPIRISDSRTDSGNIEPFKTPAFNVPPLGVNAKAIPFGSSSEPAYGNRVELRNQSAFSTESYSTLNEVVQPISGPVSDRIRTLETALTAELLKPPVQWQLETILRQATSIATTSNDMTEHGHAQRLIDKIKKCTRIQSSFEFAYNGTPNAKSSYQATGTGTGTGTGFNNDFGVDSQVQLGTTYDAYGWLNELVRDKGRVSPTFVLEDENGKIICHVAPAPGLNLNRYLKSKVGVIGRRGYHRELQMNHVTAERIVELDTIRR